MFPVKCVAAVIIGVGMLSGCASNIAERQARAEVAERSAKLAQCKQQFDQHHMVDRAKCSTGVVEAYMHLVRYPDLQRLLNAEREALAAKIDKGEISYEEGELRGAQFLVQITNQGEQRNATRAGSDAALMQGRAAVLSNFKWSSPPPMPVYTPPQPITCQHVGQVSYCN